MRFGRAGVIFNAFFVLDSYVGRRRVDRLFAPLRRWNDKQLLRTASRRLSAGRPPSPVPSVSRLSPEAFLSTYARRGRPVVIRGFAADVAAVSKWTPDYFAARYGDLEVQTVDG